MSMFTKLRSEQMARQTSQRYFALWDDGTMEGYQLSDNLEI